MHLQYARVVLGVYVCGLTDHGSAREHLDVVRKTRSALTTSQRYIGMNQPPSEERASSRSAGVWPT